MKKLISLLACSLIGCSFEGQDLKVEYRELPMPELVANPLPEYPDLLNSTFIFGNRCGVFAVGPRTVLTASHCLRGEFSIGDHNVNETTLVWLDKNEYRAGHTDRARLFLPGEARDFVSWFEIDTPRTGELAMVVGEFNQHYFLATVESQREDGEWNLSNVDGEDFIPGDSGSPVVSVATGKVIGIVTHFGLGITPVVGF